MIWQSLIHVKHDSACLLRVGLLGRHNSITTNEIIDRNVLATMVSLIQSVKHKNQLAGLKVVSGLALSSEAAAKKLLTKELLTGLKVALATDASVDLLACQIKVKIPRVLCWSWKSAAVNFMAIYAMQAANQIGQPAGCLFYLLKSSTSSKLACKRPRMNHSALLQ